MKKFFGMMTVVAAALMPLTSQAAPTVFFKPAAQSVAAGDAVSLGVWISGLKSMQPQPNGEVISAFDLDIHLSNTNLTFVSATYSVDAPLGATGVDPLLADFEFTSVVVDAQNIDVKGNSFLTDSLAGLQSDEFLLFTLDFTAGQDDLSTLLTFGGDADMLSRNVTGYEDFLRETSFGEACVTVGDSAGCQQAVPEPGSYALTAVALLAAGVAGRTRRRSRAAV